MDDPVLSEQAVQTGALIAWMDNLLIDTERARLEGAAAGEALAEFNALERDEQLRVVMVRQAMRENERWYGSTV